MKRALLIGAAAYIGLRWLELRRQGWPPDWVTFKTAVNVIEFPEV
jgi:hypothetical protein